MRLFKHFRSLPRGWKYAVVSVFCFVLGGVGVAGAAPTLGITQIGWSNGGTTNVAHVDGAGSLQVGGSVAVSNLPATQPVSGTVNVGNTVGVTGAVQANASTDVVSSPGTNADPGSTVTFNSFPNIAAYRSITMYVKVGTAGNTPDPCHVYTRSPTTEEQFSVGSFTLNGLAAVFTLDPAPPNIDAVTCTNNDAQVVTFDLMVTGRTG